MSRQYGATRDEWTAFIALARNDVRPIVSDPNVKPSAASTVKDPLKVPTTINRNGEYAGMLGWQTKTPTEIDLKEWSSMPQYGISLVGRKFKAIDIDIDDAQEAEEVADAISEYFGCRVPTRRRESQARRLMIFRLQDSDSVLKKFVINTAKGKIEFLFDRQQFVVAGTHKTGARHFWEGGIPTEDEVPTLTVEALKGLREFLIDEFGIGESGDVENENSVVIAMRDVTQIDDGDAEYRMILESDLFKEILPDGKISIRCPWEHLHTTSAEHDSPTTTVYFPKGLGGRNESGFKCQHTTHGEKTIYHLREYLGFVPPEFEVVPVPDDEDVVPQTPVFVGVSKNSLPPSTPNIVNCLMTPQWLGAEICLDEFLGSIRIRWSEEDYVWRDFRDADYPRLVIQLMQRAGFKDVPKEKLRDAVILAAESTRRDSAIEWIQTLKWDGTKRIHRTAADILGAEDTPYAEAVSLYMWTAMAGRIIRPGAKADMVPVLVGRQGARKSTFVHSLCPPDMDWHTDLSFETRDADTYRMVRGKVVAEIPEMRGMGSREEEAIKAWLTKTEDSWVPKFQENAVTLKRRFLMIGTHNHARFLSDTTGNRRWLPMKVCKTRDSIDIDTLEENILQYWAEAKNLFENKGILWRDAEHLARTELYKYMRIDMWRDPIHHYITHGWDNATPLSATTLAAGALGMNTQQMTSSTQFRIENVLRVLGYDQDEDTGFWYPRDLT